MTRTRVGSVAAMVSVSLLVLAGCGDGDSGDGGSKAAESSPPAAAQSSGPNDFACLEGEQLKGSTTFELADGSPVDGYLTGSGTTGIVLAHQSNLDVCSWVPAADELAKDGYRVLAVNSSANEVDEAVAGAKLLREKGATKIVLMGASKGGTGSLAAAAVIDPPVSAVVSVSGPTTYGDVDALAAAPKLTMPVYLIAGSADGRFAENAKELDKALKSAKGKKLELVDAGEHGNFLLETYPEVWQRVKAFIKQATA
ncbi:dienelactone hydrolase family protein [Streptomyces sp. NPDC051940]|uniref:alpha/beta hydrolase family protein n=1 Tax=Streptomyces sp. NPDC051940 TaxID=3155675 RepID=UPI00343C1355